MNTLQEWHPILHNKGLEQTSDVVRMLVCVSSAVWQQFHKSCKDP